MDLHHSLFAAGTVEGTGAAINIRCGFKPRYVKIINIDGATNPTVEWVEGMAAASGLKTIGIADNGTTSGVSSDIITAGGISQLAGDTTAADGFTIGADATANASGETIMYIAHR